MSIEDLDKIDKVFIERATDKALLLISDHLPWDIDEGRHLELLQAKVYRQLDAIESGELFEQVPSTRGRPVAILIYSLFDLSQEGRKLIENLTPYLASMGVELRWLWFDHEPPPPLEET